jgi:uncharacterized protein YyaL (SSP411 family)
MTNETESRPPMSSSHTPNRLANEKSPYLLQHAANPVDWYPWGEEAFAKAKATDRPIFLSIGYATCHWCHVMERESFENPEIARLLNTLFVPIKVDREERPDVDRMYMAALNALGHNGGWPMSMFLTPGLTPFYGGTYFPPEDRHGRAGFPHVLRKIADLWNTERSAIEASATSVVTYLKEVAEANGDTAVDPSAAATRCLEEFAGMFDHAEGGFGGAPKFPRPSVFHFLTRYHHRTGDAEALAMATETLDAMAAGGVYDHIGGGFHRYSVDAAWRVPHFEKMLYDQAQLVLAYLDAHQITRSARMAAIVRETIAYVLRDLTGPEGEFYSAEDADSAKPDDPSEHGEGAFYLWSMEEIRRVLGDDAGEFVSRYGIEEEGNAPFDPGNEFTGLNILYRPARDEDAPAVSPEDDPAVDGRMQRALKALLQVRAARPRPLRDDKVLAAWNGMMIAACARAGAVLNEPSYITAAQKAATFVLGHLYDPAAGTLLRRWREGEARFAAHLDDHMWLVAGLLELYAATGDPAWLENALAIANAGLAKFADVQGGGFFDTDGADGSVLVRMKERHDGAEPSGNAIAAWVLARLAALTGGDGWQRATDRFATAFQPWLEKQPSVMPHLTATLQGMEGKGSQLVIVGPSDHEETRAMLRAYWTRFLPDTVLIRVEDPARDALGRLVPFAAQLPLINGKPAAYLCEDFACRLPVTSADDLGGLLDALRG